QGVPRMAKSVDVCRSDIGQTHRSAPTIGSSPSTSLSPLGELEGASVCPYNREITNTLTDFSKKIYFIGKVSIYSLAK
ncbi:MAG: hypothetical protein ACI4B3_11205, partial [Prevotella sp.]